MRAVDVCESKRRFQKGEGLSEKLSYYVEGKQQIDCQKKKTLPQSLSAASQRSE